MTEKERQDVIDEQWTNAFADQVVGNFSNHPTLGCVCLIDGDAAKVFDKDALRHLIYKCAMRGINYAREMKE